MSNPRFPNLPDEISDIIHENLEIESFPSCKRVSTSWYNFFSKKEEIIFNKIISALLPNICKEKTFEEIKPDIEKALRCITKGPAK